MLNKKHLIFFLGSLLFFLFANSGLAFALEITYPSVPGLIAPSANCTGGDCLSIYVAYFFGLLVYVSGALALISFTIGAISLIASADNPESASSGKDRMKGAILGLVLTLAAFLILRTINPTFITPSLTPLSGVAGIYYYNKATDERKPVGMEVDNVANRGEDLNNFDYIIYDCSDASSAPVLLIWKYPNINFQGNDENFSGATVVRRSCGETEFIAGDDSKSFKIDYETPGIYYCLGGCRGTLCSGYMSKAATSSDGEMAAPFKQNTKGVRIVGNYGAIFHGGAGLDSINRCDAPIINTSDRNICTTVGVSAFAADIFALNNSDYTSSGNGVAFYSEAFGWDTNGTKALRVTVDNKIIGASSPQIFKASADKLVFFKFNTDADFDYNQKVDQPDKYKYKCEGSNTAKEGCSDTACVSFQDCPGSIKRNGDYLVALYSKNADGSLYCRTFTKDANNLPAEDFIAPTGEEVGDVWVIPTKQ